jgi:hypothetical protein
VGLWALHPTLTRPVAIPNRNKFCFDKKLIKDPCEILCNACFYMKYWAGLHDAGFKKAIIENAAILLKATIYPSFEVPV